MDAAAAGNETRLASLIATIGPGRVVSGEDAIRYQVDFTGDHRGQALAVVRPRDVGEVAQIMAWATTHGVPVVPFGGNTGLVGAQIPSLDGGELVLSLERLDQVRDIDTANGVAIVEAGCVLSVFKERCAEAGAFFPVSIGSEGSCQIGGILSTNAGGVNVVRYGMARAQVLGIEVVLPDGSVFSDLRGLRKNNTGYDLKQLFIGAEGTLGVITAAAVRLLPPLTQVETVFVATASNEATVALFERMRREAGDLITAFELMEGPAVDRVCATEEGLRHPLESRHPSHAIMEFSAVGGPQLRDWLEDCLGRLIEDEMILDGTIAASDAQVANIWGLREGIVESQARLGPYLRTDIATPIARVPELITLGKALVEQMVPGAQPLVYGHIGDGNTHFNVMRPEAMPEAEFLPWIHRIEHGIFEIVDRLGGSISAEHGIGIAKLEEFQPRLDPVARRLMIALKQAFDPGNILCPGRMLPEEWLKDVVQG